MTTKNPNLGKAQLIGNLDRHKNYCFNKVGGILEVMLNIRTTRLLKVILLSGFMLIGVNVGHIAAANSSTMDGMAMKHGTSAAQCQSICTSNIKTSIQDVLTVIRRDEQEPKPLPFYVGEHGDCRRKAADSDRVGS